MGVAAVPVHPTAPVCSRPRRFSDWAVRKPEKLEKAVPWRPAHRLHHLFPLLGDPLRKDAASKKCPPNATCNTQSMARKIALASVC